MRARSPSGLRLTALPDGRGWRLSLIVFLCFAGLAVPFGLSVDLLDWSPTADGVLATAAIALFLPALGEELAFRGPLLYAPARWRFAAGAGLLSAFILWHPLNAWLFLPQALPLFIDPRFLILAAGLGLAASLATVMSRSLVPAVAIHWATVFAWKQLFAGARFLPLPS